ncbi:MAG: peptidylprolyl isomerase [Lacipirellulaceae bacterium]
MHFNFSRQWLPLLVTVVAALLAAPADATIVRFSTVMGTFDVRMFDKVMPRTVANFVGYANRGDYENSLVHRSAFSGPTPFVIQGGGWEFNNTTQVEPRNFPVVPTQPQIADEPGGGVTGLSNVRGTIAMAKSGPNTVTSQWFINLGNNSGLDAPTRPDGGFSAFGRVLGTGMTVVDAISALPRFAFQSPWNEAPMRNYTQAQYNAFTPVGADNVVLINNITVRSLAAGDYDRDGDVDLADYGVWQSTYGSTTNADADGNGDGIVNAADYTVWRDTFTAAATAVPEPTGAALLATALAAARRRRRG